VAFINAGAFVDGNRPATKKALKDAVKDNPASVWFYGTSPMGPACPRTLAELAPGTTLTVAGPDPYNSRKWYASVTVANGKPKVT
jgi:hypothetical protein